MVFSASGADDLIGGTEIFWALFSGIAKHLRDVQD